MSIDLPPPWLQRHRWAVGALIRSHRKAAELSQVELGELSKIDHKTISRIENGITATDIDVIARLAAAMRVPSADMFPRDLQLPDEDIVPRLVNPPEVAEAPPPSG